VDVVRKAGREEAAPELGLPRDREPSLAEPGPGAADGLEAFVEKRVVDDGDDARVPAFDPDRDAEARKAVGEVPSSARIASAGKASRIAATISASQARSTSVTRSIEALFESIVRSVS
jgi:hypothetical protein